MACPRRLGFLYPDYAAEDDYPRMAPLVTPPVQVEVVHTPVDQDLHDPDVLRQTGEMNRLIRGAQELRERKVDVIMWACTSASFVFGWEGAKQQAASLQESAGVPASSTSLAFAEALDVVAIDRVAIAASYPDGVAQLFKDFLVRSGREVLHLGSLGIMSGAEVSTVGKEEVLRLILANDHPDAQAILVPDTALHTAGLIDDLEDAVQKMVLTANQVTMWQALRLAAHPHPYVQLGMGSLFRSCER